MTSLTVRTFVRYLVPVTLLAALAFAPLLYQALNQRAPANVAQARMVLRFVWQLAAFSLISLLVLVGGVAPMVRAMAAARACSQVSALATGFVGMARGLVTALVVAIAVGLGSLALVVPGVVVLVLFALAPASTEHGVSARLADSIAVVRANLRTTVLVLAAVLVAFASIVLVQQLALSTPLPNKPTPAQLDEFRLLVRTSMFAIAGAAPIFAIAIAAIHARARRA